MKTSSGNTALVSVSVAMALALASCQPHDAPSPQPQAAATPPAPATYAAAAAVDNPGAPVALAVAPVETDFTSVASCNMEQIDGKPFGPDPVPVKAGGSFALGGFLYDAVQKAIPAQMTLRATLDGEPPQAWEGAFKGRVDRAEIPTYMHLVQWAAGEGYLQDFSTTGLPPGTYHLMVTFAQGGKQYICDNGRHITIAAATP
jgi:hypothetical protein